jgi:3',5'-cyclic-AMP phosphodiesterase
VKTKGVAFILLLLLSLLWACENPFSFSPFEARVPETLRHTTDENLKRINELDATWTDTVVHVALISDPHYHFNNLNDALLDINRKNEAAFIIVTGDLTENGLQKEFELFRKIMNTSELPYVTVIGNHDYLSNGGEVYQQIFGQLNYSFTFQDVKFVMWDDVVWESKKNPDWQWLKEQFTSETKASANTAQKRIIPFSHIPPDDPQVTNLSTLYRDLMVNRGAGISIHGHKHKYTAEQYYGDGVTYITIGSPQMRAYAMLTITPSKISVRKIEY